MAFAFGGRLLQDQACTAIARNLLDYYLFTSDARKRERGNPEHGAYGLIAWGINSPEWYRANSGDPVADLLYTTNFAFLGLHEAAAATGAQDVIEAEDRLAQFLCRIQVASDVHRSVDGGWFRAFDFGRREHWGSNADLGWGAWAIESGWTQGWIISVLAMRHLKTSLWELTRQSTIERHFERLRKQMIPDEALRSLDARGQPP